MNISVKESVLHPIAAEFFLGFKQVFKYIFISSKNKFQPRNPVYIVITYVRVFQLSKCIYLLGFLL